MRRWSLVTLSLLVLACGARSAPRTPALAISLKGLSRVNLEANVDVNVHGRAGGNTTATVDANVDANADANADTNVGAGGTVVVEAEAEAPPPPPEPVPIQGADVVEFFGVPLEGVADVVFVLDRSGSMDDLAQGAIAQVADQAAAPRKIDVAQAELIDALQRLPAGTKINLIFFNDDVEAYAAGLIELDDGSREALIAFVREMPPTGRTALAPAMRTAFLMNAHRVVLLSDGLGNVGGDANDLLRDAHEAMAGDIRIDTIGLGQDQDGYLLESLARDSGGLYQSL